MGSSKQFEVNLIHEVEKNDFIYNTAAFNYRNNAKRVLAWQTISKTLNVPAEKCQQRWKSIRARYRNEMKIRKAGQIPKKTWMLMPYLEFLSQYLDDGTMENFMVGNDQDPYDDQDLSQEPDEEDELDFTTFGNTIQFNAMGRGVNSSVLIPEQSLTTYEYDSPHPGTSTSGYSYTDSKNGEKRKRKSSVSSTDSSNNKRQAVEDLFVQELHETNAMCDVELSCISAAKTVKEWPKKKQALFKVKLSQLLFDLEFNNNNDTNS